MHARSIYIAYFVACNDIWHVKDHEHAHKSVDLVLSCYRASDFLMKKLYYFVVYLKTNMIFYYTDLKRAYPKVDITYFLNTSSIPENFEVWIYNKSILFSIVIPDTKRISQLGEMLGWFWYFSKL